jgi:hypothetical protein
MNSEPKPTVTIGSKRDGYPCPKDGTMLDLMPGGGWCPECHTVWREAGEVTLADLDALPETKEDSAT